MNPIVLQKVDPAAGHLKFYRLTLIEGAETCAVRHQWGRIGYPPRESYTTCPDRMTAETVLSKTLAKKQKGGYLLTELLEVPEHHLNDSCPSCEVLRANAGILGGKSALYVQSNYLAVIFRDHVPIEALDVASLAKFMGEVRGIMRQYPKAPDLVFPAHGHAVAHLLGQPPALVFVPKEEPPEGDPGAPVGRQLSWID